MPNFSIGLSALRTSQYALDIVSNNIANANNEGYHRQKVHQAALQPNQLSGFRIGSGVKINYIERVRDHVTESSLTNAISDTTNIDQRLSLKRQIEATFLNGSASIGGELDQFFAEVTKLTSAPDEPAQKAAVVESGKRIARVIQQARTQLAELKNSVKFQIGQEVEQLNTHMLSLTEMTLEIKSLTARGFPANAELDDRDSLLNQVAEQVGLSRSDHLSGELNLRIGHNSIQQSSIPNQFSIIELPDDQIGVLLDDSARPVDLESGRILALMEAYNTTIPHYEAKLETLALEFMQQVDQIHATGIGTNGGFRNLVASRPVEFLNRTLDQAGTAFPIEAGDLRISITDSTGYRRTETVTIDPAVDTLADVAARLTAIDGLSGTVNTESNQLLISTSEGTTFDFTGRLETQPRLTAFTGTSVPSFSGNYTGDVNTQRRFEIEGSGDVGISNNLFVNVYNDSGVLLERLNIGQGYEAGTDLDVGDGVLLNFSRGTVVDTETFETPLVANPDETGILAALGFNTFFDGVNASTIEVNPDIVENHDQLASGSTGAAADTSNLFRLSELEDWNGLPGNVTFSEYVNEINTEIGFEISTHTSLSRSLNSLKLRLEQDRSAVSGVDLNEEMVYLQEFQKSYEAAVRVIQAADEVLNELFSILR